MPDSDGDYAPESPDLTADLDSHPPETSTYQPLGYTVRSAGSNPSVAAAPSRPPPPTIDHDDEPVKVHGPAAMGRGGGATNGRGGGRRKAGKNAAAAAAPPAKKESEIKTKFPVARIKRIMQADEDVGKVSQVTPIAVAKALELFMVSLVSRSAEEARASSAKRVTTEHLKRAVAKEEEYDFLRDIIAKVPDAPPPQDKSEDDPDGDGRRKRSSAGKRKKSAVDDF
ncbi:MAG: hypothetical protein M1826_002788 [Phylliscum demangeonii]|nr:MAG: hypothetical protein M1826_002788 [Phylliscum demangeonii]